MATPRLSASGANRAVSALRGAATTLAVTELGANRVSRSYHAGDTPALVVSGRGAVKLKTVDHSPVGYAVEAGVIAEEDAIHHQYRHVISNFLGSPDMRIEVNAPLRMAARDRLLIASDGLFDNLHLNEIVEIIRKGQLLTAARRLVRLCRERMETPRAGLPSKPDDLSFVLWVPDPVRPRRGSNPPPGGESGVAAACAARARVRVGRARAREETAGGQAIRSGRNRLLSIP